MKLDLTEMGPHRFGCNDNHFALLRVHLVASGATPVPWCSSHKLPHLHERLLLKYYLPAWTKCAQRQPNHHHAYECFRTGVTLARNQPQDCLGCGSIHHSTLCESPCRLIPRMHFGAH